VGYDGNPLGPTNGGSATTNSNDFAQQLAKAFALLAGGVGGRAIANSQGNPLTSAVPPELSQLLQMSNQRYAYQNPLFQATTQGAYDMLPDFAKTGTSLTGSLPNAIPAANSGSGGTSGPGLGTAAGLGGLSALLALLGGSGGGGGSLSKVFDEIKKKFHGSQPTPAGVNATGPGFVNGSGGSFDESGDWVPDQGMPDLTPETSGRAFGPNGDPLQSGPDPMNGDPNADFAKWLQDNGFGGYGFGGGSGTNAGSGEPTPWEKP
jgi:hypothetical protein